MKRNFCFLIWLVIANFSFAQTTRSALFVGNSYTYANDLPKMVSDLATASGNEFSYTSSTIGGALLGTHAGHQPTLDKIDFEEYDYLILQEQSIRLADKENGFAKYFHKSYRPADFLDHRSRLVDSCHKTMLFLSWGRKEGHSIFQPPGYYGSNYQEMQNNLTKNYSQLAELLNAEIAPVGEAWRRIVSEHPEIELYTGDGSHPNIAGTYLAACVFYVSIFREELNISWKPGALSIADAANLRNVANEVVSGDWSQWNINVNSVSCQPAGIKTNTDDWLKANIDSYAIFDKVEFTDNKHAYVKGSGREVWQTLNSGDDWTKIELPVQNQANDKSTAANTYDVFFLNRDTLWFVIGDDEVDSSSLVFTGIWGFKGNFTAYVRFFKSVDGGKNWEEKSPGRISYKRLDSALLRGRPTFTNLRLHFDDNNNGTVICNYGTEDTVVYAFNTTNGGVSWNHGKAFSGRSSGNLWFEDSEVAYRSGFKDSVSEANQPQKLFKTEDSGNSWQEIAAFKDDCCEIPYYNIEHDLSAFYKQGEDTLFALSSLYAPVLYRSTDNGKNWDSVSVVPVIGELTDFLVLKEGVYMVTTNGWPSRIMISFDYGKNWHEEAYFKYGLNRIASTEKYIYTIGFQGSVYRKLKALIPDKPEEPKEVKQEFKLYPNPTQSLVNFEGLRPYSSVSLHSVRAKLLGVYKANGEGELQINISHLSTGMYFVRVVLPDKTMGKKIILD